MVSAKENPKLDDVNRPQPICVKVPPDCYQDGRTFKQTDVNCILCDYFVSCKKAKKIGSWKNT
ncbi:MAG: hypothetical protein ACTSRG_09865 [Candidatus Helarchaeota archaeon]